MMEEEGRKDEDGADRVVQQSMLSGCVDDA